MAPAQFAADKLYVVEDAQLAGRIVYWSLNGTVEYESFKEACIAAGLPESLMPYAPTSERALKRALEGFLSEKHLVARAIKQMPGYSLFLETQQPTKVRLTPELSVYVRDSGDDFFPKLIFNPEDHPLCKEIRKRFIFAISELDAVAVSAWLNRVLATFSSISLRPMGGFYFIPRPEVERWNKCLEPLKQTSHHTFYSIPALSSDDVVAAVLDALTAEATKVADDLNTELTQGDLGVRALSARVYRCDEMNRKFEMYEGIIGSRLDDLRAAFSKLQAKASTMVLLAQADEGK